MTVKLFFQALSKLLLGFALIGLLLFVPAGSMKYYQAWLFIGILFVPIIVTGFVMMAKSPELLKKRLSAKEEENEQKAVVALSGLMFLGAFIVAGLSFRFEWIVLPMWASCIAAAVFLGAYALYIVVMKENEFLSRKVEVQENQKVVDTGLYGIVRHPMYMSTVLLFLSMPLVLGSVISFLIMLFYLPIIALRIKNEEKVLEEGLEGYTEYKKKVKYRLIPYVW